MKSNSVVLVFLALSYFACLGAVQYFYVGELFAYYSFKSEFDIVKFTVSICTIVIFYNLFKTDGVVKAYTQVLLAAILIPTLVIFSFGAGSYDYFVTTTSGCFIVLLISNFYKPKAVVTKQLDEQVLLRLLTAISVTYVLSIFAMGGGAYLNFNIAKVYDFRESASENLPGVYSYISPIVGKIVVPMVVVLSAIKKQYMYTLIGIVISVLIFGLTSHKSPLFYPIIILTLYYMPWTRFPYFLLLGCISISIVSFIDFYFMKNGNNPLFGWFGTLLGRRVLLVPANLNSIFIEFFSTNPIYLWSESKFSFGLLDMPYDLRAPNLIGRIYYGDELTAANTGWIGSGYFNARFPGVVFYSFLVGMLIAYFGSVARRIGEKFVFGTSFVVVITIFLSADFSTVILTHGLVALLFLLLFFKRDSMLG